MAVIQIPDQDFSFEQVVKHKAKELIIAYISIGTIIQPYTNQKGKIEQEINNSLIELSNTTDKIIFLKEIISHVATIKIEYDKNFVLPPGKPAQIFATNDRYENLLKFETIQFFLYDKLTNLGFKIRTDVFDTEEINDLDSKINTILDALTKLQSGQEIIFDHIDELKDDFESLKSDYLSGKKPWYQRAGGIMLTYAGEKGADEIYALLKPYLIALFINAPHLIEGFIKQLTS